MVYPDFSRFKALAAAGNFIPVYRELVADLETPVSAWYRVCAGQPYSFLLESVEGGERLGRYSFLGCDPLWVLQARGDRTRQTHRNGSVTEYKGDPFNILADCLAPLKPVHLPELPASIAGLVGYWGYDLMRWIEPTVPVFEPEPDDPPDGLYVQVDSILIFDQVKRKIWVVAYANLQDRDLETAYADACDRVQALVDKLTAPLDSAKLYLNWSPPSTTDIPYTASVSQERFCEQVVAAKEYIKAGDIFQVVLSQRLTAPFEGDPFTLYRALRLINPSPYMAYLQLGDMQLIGSSPEVMVKLDRAGDRNIASVRPIAGTRPRGRTQAEDLALGEELLVDPKERAEHVMLVDLGRNDLGRVCDRGSVSVDELMSIERYSHVMHIVSNVVGTLEPDRTAWDLLKATFPAGTVSGAPKIRAMQIIHELEGLRRGPYSGAYGFYDFTGQLNTAITIRTAIVQQGRVFVQAGAGIVADSEPEKEYQETLNKARGMLEAIALAMQA
ncbi:anthranilate synthase component I [Synechococcus sp. PCC 7336]|uniref:anthranilate synthase component I n=1 Tax=Synechococcus sp. PCC 7336 TaxID=195250 RepID=UPI000368980E|nr:anthranilate synthase component I [Synechococcus sp. PCC 7336]